MSSGTLIDPTKDKTAERGPPPDAACISFNNAEIGYYSYDPRKGFTAEEIMQFQGAKECLTVEKVEELIKERDEKGTLEIRMNQGGSKR